MATAPKRSFDPAYLLDYSAEHVFYEFDMFLWSAKLCASRPALTATSEAEATRLSNALIEDFVIHLRNVIDFLYPKSPKDTDVVAADFCPSGGWQPTISGTLDDVRVRANKELAHLTTARIPGNRQSKGWDFTGLSTEILPVMHLFVSKALPARLSPEVEGVLV
jgi:hypothetical protein